MAGNRSAGDRADAWPGGCRCAEGSCGGPRVARGHREADGHHWCRRSGDADGDPDLRRLPERLQTKPEGGAASRDRDVREVIIAEFSQAFSGGEIRDKQIALYAKYFTQADVKGLISFYESDLGRKTVANMPSLMREGGEIGQQSGRRARCRGLFRRSSRASGQRVSFPSKLGESNSLIPSLDHLQ